MTMSCAVCPRPHGTLDKAHALWIDMSISVHILVLAERDADAELMADALRQAGYDPVWRRLATEPDFLAHLDPSVDLILADYALEHYDALRALRERGLDIPLVLVTSTIDEEVAMATLR